MADLVITADVSSIRDAEKALKRFSDASEKLGRSVLNTANKVQNVSSGWDQANKLYKQGVLNSQALAAAQTELARELATLNGYTKSNGALNTQRALAELRAAQAARGSARATEEAARAAQQAANRQRELRMRYQEGYATFARARQEMRGLREAMRAGIITTDQYRERVRLLREEMNRSGDAAQGVGRRMSRTGVLIQQTGYQVGDFIVQVQSGTNAFVAFGQQATQLAGTLTLLKGKWLLIGSVLGVAIPLITAVAAAFMRTREQSKGLTNDTNGLRKEVDELSNTIQNLSVVQRAVGKDFETGLTKAFEESASAVGRLLSELRAARFEAAMRPVIDSLTEMTVGIDRVNVAVSTISGFNALIKDGEKLSVVQQALLDDATALLQQNILLALNYNDISSALDAISESETTKGLIVSFAEALEKADALANEVIGKQLYQALVDAAEEAGVLDEALALIEGSADSAADSTGGISRNLRDATNEALRLRDAMNSVGRAALSRQDQVAVLRSQIAAARAGTSVAGAEASTETALELSRAGATMDQIAAAAVAAGQQATLVESLESTLSGLLKTDTGPKGSGGKDPAQSTAEYLEKLKKEAEFKLQLVGLSEQEQRGMEIKKQYLETLEQDNRALTDAEQSRIDAILKSEEALRKATEAEQRREKIQQSITSNIEGALMSLVEGTASVEDAFKTMLRNILLEIFRQQVANPIAKGVASFFAADGAVLSRGNVVPFANGGVVGSPTFFPMSGGRTGLMGEAGPEAIMPLKRGPNGKLGVEGGSNVTVQQTFNFAANGDESVKRIIAEAAPKIANLTQKQILDSRRRGGTMKATFG